MAWLPWLAECQRRSLARQRCAAGERACAPAICAHRRAPSRRDPRGLRLRGSVRRWSTRGGGHAWLCGRRFVRRGRIAVRHLSCPGGRGLPPEQHRRLGSPPQRWPLPPHRSARGCRRTGACACQALHRPGCGAGAGRGAEKAARGGVGAAAAAMGAALGRGRAQPGDGGRGRAALCGSRRA